jgi:hypothetical protein
MHILQALGAFFRGYAKGSSEVRREQRISSQGDVGFRIEHAQRRRFSNLAASAAFCLTIFAGWRTEDQVLLAAQIGIVLGMVLEALSPEPPTRPKAVKVTSWAVLAATMALMTVGLWREIFHRNTLLGQVVPTSLQITPAQGPQGKTLAVTITGTSFRFTNGSIPHFGSGITVLDSRYTGEKALAAHVQIVAGTPVGFRRVWVSTPGAQTAMDDSASGAFQVVAGDPRDK